MTSDECQVPKFVSYGGDESVFLGKSEKKILISNIDQDYDINSRWFFILN